MELWCRSLDRDLGPVPANGNGALRSARRLIRAQPVQDRRELRGRPALHHIGIVPITRVDLGRAQLVIHRIPHVFAEAVERPVDARTIEHRSEKHTSELQSLMRNSYAVFCLQKKHTSYYIK